MLLKKPSIKLLLYKLDSFIQYYPSTESTERIDVSGKTHFIIPYSHHSSSSYKKQTIYDIYVPEYIFSNKVKKLNGFVFVFRPEIHLDVIKLYLQNIYEIFRIYRGYFSSFKFFYILIPQISTISHFQVLQKLSLCSSEFQRLFESLANLLLFVKFIDVQSHPWPVILKDTYWLNHFDGDIQAKNNQFFKLLETIESFPYNTVKILSEPLIKHSDISTLFISSLMPTTGNIIEESRCFCFGCRTMLTTIRNRCRICGINLCDACSTIIESQPISQKMCPGNIYTATNVHDFER